MHICMRRYMCKQTSETGVLVENCTKTNTMDVQKHGASMGTDTCTDTWVRTREP